AASPGRPTPPAPRNAGRVPHAVPPDLVALGAVHLLRRPARVRGRRPPRRVFLRDPALRRPRRQRPPGAGGRHHRLRRRVRLPARPAAPAVRPRPVQPARNPPAVQPLPDLLRGGRRPVAVPACPPPPAALS